MSDKEWEKFFELIDKIIDLPGVSANERGALIREKASENGSETNLQEFCSVAAEA